MGQQDGRGGGSPGVPARRRGQGELEAQVLAALRAAPEPVPAGWVREHLGGTLAYTTVITILTRLQAKGVVTRQRAGRSFAWTAAADEAGLAAHRMRRVLDGETNRQAVLASFVSSLPPQDEELLRRLFQETEGTEETEETEAAAQTEETAQTERGGSDARADGREH
ncbi:BlaI/MecI/CopY family transcriptional regulator [Streptomyces sp. NPDC048419]|uniref:BlaI/MecI/CopY family transcriptional regulator n=1 Tax=Streptomyces sp. NPDC048419 TaxID=3365547 RepID=UPI00372041AF